MTSLALEHIVVVRGVAERKELLDTESIVGGEGYRLVFGGERGCRTA